MRKILIFVFLFFIPCVIYSKFANTYEFLNIPETGINEIASQCGSAIVEGIESVYCNPAGFAENKSKNIIFSDTENIGNTRKLSLFYGDKARFFNYALGVKYFYLKECITFNNSGVNYNSYSINFLISHNIKFIKKHLNYGINLKFIKSTIWNYHSSLILFNIGVIYKMCIPLLMGKVSKENFTTGISIQNVGFIIKSYNQEEKIPLIVNVGFKYKIVHSNNFDTSIFINYSYNILAQKYLSSGLKLNLFNFIFLSCAYKFGNFINPISTGVGLNYRLNKTNYGFYYTLMPVKDLDCIHTVSLIISL